MKLNRMHYRAVLEAALDYREGRRSHDVHTEVIGDDVWYIFGTHAVRLPLKDSPFNPAAFPHLPELHKFLRGEETAIDLELTPTFIEEDRPKHKKAVLRKFLAAGGEEVLVDADILKVFPPKLYYYRIASGGDDIRKNVIFCYQRDPYDQPGRLAGIMLPVYRPQKDAAPDAPTSETAE